MSDSYSCEQELKEIAKELHRKAYELEEAADTLEVIRKESNMEERIKKAKEWAKQWMKP